MKIRLSYAKPVPSDPVEICIHNILNVEQSYIKTLTLMEDNFMEPLAKVLTRREMEIIFYGIKVVTKSMKNQEKRITICLKSYNRS